MPRNARQKSSSGIYHIMLRGANRKIIFHDDKDSIRFLDILEKYKVKSEIELYAWCLMGNHVHLLLKEGIEDLAVTMKRIGVSYAWYYNKKYKVVGHLFQDRYKSENVESDEYLLAVIRYIHQNPVQSGIVKRPKDWKWSSCKSYYSNGGYHPFLVDKDMVLDIFSEDRLKAIKRFREFNEQSSEKRYLDDEVKVNFTDEEAKIRIDNLLKSKRIIGLKDLPKGRRDEIIAEIKNIDGLTQRQISRVLEISLSVINRA